MSHPRGFGSSQHTVATVGITIPRMPVDPDFCTSPEYDQSSRSVVHVTEKFDLGHGQVRQLERKIVPFTTGQSACDRAPCDPGSPDFAVKVTAGYRRWYCAATAVSIDTEMSVILNGFDVSG